MNTAVYEVANQATTRQIVETAVQNYRLRRKEKGLPEATDKEIQDFYSKVMESVLKSQAVADETFRNRKEQADKEEARRVAIINLAKGQGIRFIQCRKEFINETASGHKYLGKHVVSYEVVAHFEVLRRGGQTVAYRYRVDDAGDLFMDYSIATCFIEDDFNDVIGMEESYRKFMEGKVVAMPITHDKLGAPKLKAMGKVFKQMFPSKEPE